MLLLLDNYDSFTYNLVNYFRRLGQQVVVVRNDELSVDQLLRKKPNKIVLSPGPGTPQQAGIAIALVQRVAGVLPLLGVCLGHQAIGAAFGAKIVAAQHILHGKVSAIYHQQNRLYHQLPSPFQATRYHSLVIEPQSLAACFEVCAWTLDDNEQRHEIMGICHQQHPIHGVQFHPESILTEHGLTLLENFCKL